MVLASASRPIRSEYPVLPGEHALVEVEDAGGPWAPGPADPSRSHGLDIIGTIAAEWNVRGDHRRRTIWARLDWSAPAGGDGTSGRSAPAASPSGTERQMPARVRPLTSTGNTA